MRETASFSSAFQFRSPSAHSALVGLAIVARPNATKPNTQHRNPYFLISPPYKNNPSEDSRLPCRRQLKRHKRSGSGVKAFELQKLFLIFGVSHKAIVEPSGVAG